MTLASCVASELLSGTPVQIVLGMVATLLAGAAFGLMNGLIVVYGYSVEAFMAWYSATPMEGFMIANRVTGPYWWAYWTLIFCNGVIPQLLWFKRVRMNIPLLFLISLIVNGRAWILE